MPGQGRVVIIDNDGKRHVFPSGFDPRRAASIVKQQSTPAADAPRHPHQRTTDAVVSTAKGAWNVLSGIPKGLYDLAADVAPYDSSGNLKMPLGNTASALMGAHGDVGRGAIDAFGRGDYLTAARKGMNAAIPILGPAMDVSTDKMMQGNVAEGLGEVATNALLTAAGGRSRAPRTVVKPPRMAGPANPVDAAAVAFAKQEGIPLDAATATGSNLLRKVQKKVESSYGGANTADDLRASQAENLARVGTEQVNRAAPVATNPVAAGEGVRAALEKIIQDAHAVANNAYGRLRQYETVAPTTPMTVQTPIPARGSSVGGFTGASGKTPATAPSTAHVPFAVDMRRVKGSYLPIYQRLMQKKDAAGMLMGKEAEAAARLKAIIEGPDFQPMSIADAALSDLKALSRGADMPELRSSGQGTAAFAVQKLDAQVRARAAQAGPDVLKALEEGRAATRRKYEAADVLDMLSGEPGQVFRQLTQSKDVGLARLKAVEKFAPQELPKLGRAFLEDAMQQATAEGGFLHADRLWSNWQKLGGDTKRRMFSKQQIQDLDNFFLVSKRIKENPNPSGTATMPQLNFTEALAGVPAWALSKMLMTPRGVKWLTDARIVSKSPSKAARVLALTNVTKAAQSAGVPLEVIPALTEEPEIPKPSGTRR